MNSVPWVTWVHLIWSVVCLTGLWAQTWHVLIYLRSKPILLQGFGDRVTRDLVGVVIILVLRTRME